MEPRGLWTSVYDGHRIAILMFHATYTTMDFIFKRRSELVLVNHACLDQKYTAEGYQGGLVAGVTVS